jgi:primosomal protein N' (replication factor Y)
MNGSRPPIVQVAVPAPLPEALSYRVPEPLSGRLRAGMRVRVPLGRRREIGVVVGFSEIVPTDVELKDVLEALDEPEAPSLPPDLLATVLYGARHYLAPPGEMVRAALPAALSARRARRVRLTETGRMALGDPSAPDGLRWLARRRGAAVGEAALERHGVSRAERRRWEKAGWVVLEQVDGPARGAPLRRRELVPAEAVRRDPEAARQQLERAPARRRALDAALEGPPRTRAELSRAALVDAGAIAGLLRDGLLVERERDVPIEPPPEVAFPVSSPPELTRAQRAAVDRIVEALDGGGYHAVSLFGVTGSGKTEVYLRAAEAALERGRPALFLSPEIGLTPQLAHALRERFGELVVVLHSGLNDRQRYDAWQRVRRGEVRLVVGARSALFAPLDRPGLIVIDEEHDGGYKQEESPRYHARDLALVRAREAGAVAVLGSATPSLEVWSLAERGKAERVRLPERVSGGTLAAVELVDMREEFAATGEDRPISRPLAEGLEETLARREQAIVLINRRGQTRSLVCRECGEPIGCEACSISLTWHRVGERLRCHFCGHARPRPASCPCCSSPHLTDVGHGTQRVEEELQRRLPDARIERLDRDAVRSARRLAELLDGFSRGEIDVLVGTQMIAKGHHFPRVTLAGVVSADAGLGLPDFRAAERTFQLLTQVAGRAGRGDRPGRVLIQAFRAEHPALQAAVEQDFEAFAARELAARQSFHYPPASALANVILEDRDREAARDRALHLAARIRDVGQGWVAVLGPTEAPIARIRERWRQQILVRAQRRGRVADALRRAVVDLRDSTGRLPDGLRLDIDPHQLL